MANPYSDTPRADILTTVETLGLIGKSRKELHAIRNTAVTAQDWQTMQAATYAMTQLPVPVAKERG